MIKREDGPLRDERHERPSGVSFTRAELTEGARNLAAKVRRFRPRVVAILGVTAYRTAFSSPRAVLGRQPDNLNGAQVWVVPNPSGRNAHAPLDTLAAAYREVAVAAGVIDQGAP